MESFNPGNDQNDRWQTQVIAGVTCLIGGVPRGPRHGYTLIYLHNTVPDPLLEGELLLNWAQSTGVTVVAPLAGQSWWTDRVWPPFSPQFSTETFLTRHLLPDLATRLRDNPDQVESAPVGGTATSSGPSMAGADAGTDELPWQLRPALLGKGMGGQGALRIAYRHAKTFPVVSAIHPWIDMQLAHKAGDPTLTELYPDPEAARQDTALLHIHPLAWPPQHWFCGDPWDPTWFPGIERLQSKLSALGVPYACELELTPPPAHPQDYPLTMLPRALEKITHGWERERLRLV